MRVENHHRLLVPARAPLGRESFRIVGLALAYFLAHQIAFFFPDSRHTLMLIWPAGGVGLAAFLLNPRRLWPALTVAFYVTGVAADVFLAKRSLMTGLGYMTGNMLESIGCAWLILCWAKDFRRFTQVVEILALIVAAGAVNAVSSCIGAATSVLAHGASFMEAWQSWYIADGLGMLLVGPFIVTWMGIKEDFTGLPATSLIEGATFITIWSLVSLLVFGSMKMGPVVGFHPYVLVGLLVWPALRFGQRGVTLMLMLLFAIAVMSPAVIRGPCPWPGQDGDAAHRLLELQLFLGFLAVVGYLLAAGYADRQRAEEALRQSEERFRSIFNNASEGVLFTGLDGSVFAANRTACHMLGRSEQELREEGRNAVVDVTDPRLPQALEERTRTGQFRGELNFRRKDGTVFPVELSSNAFAFGTRQTRACIIFRDVSERKRTEAALCKKNAELEAALTQVNTLSGLIPICAGCKKIRDDKNFWHQVESYISQHSDARFTHSLCPDCTKKFYPELEEAPPV